MKNLVKPRISVIAALDKQRGIGFRNRLPWHIREDLIRFKKLTQGRTIIIGRKTFESILEYYRASGKPLPKRQTIVITGNSFYQPRAKPSLESLYRVSSFAEALSLAKKIEPEEVFIAGGAQVFQEGIKHAQRLYLTLVEGVFPADAFFPDYREFTEVIAFKKRSQPPYQYQFLILERANDRGK
ncbi:MAG: dihydrofolate reductase [Patescibacteria group bacterium]|nr:dihydrofolate reductase [Patescibacteria group bacterium]